MAVIHSNTTVTPGKLELLTAWLPSRDWYLGGPGEPELVKAGGFRLDDPQGEVGIEFMVARDSSGAEPTDYLVPLTYRGAPLAGAEEALVGTMEHGVLGPRWAYDGCHDPVLVAELAALIEGRAAAQAQGVSHTLDHEVVRSYSGRGLAAADPATAAAKATDSREATEVPLAPGVTLRLPRVLRPVADGEPVPPAGAAGHVAGAWRAPDGGRVRGIFAVLTSGS
ncbi:maltokinase N-terminal cap-like domain-containing protein [Phaeacidiphilus oryzae]|uniref:maltokinase N-terminal cap-like domain-containing protein n=1 Tax=Phaeacidiphilus oryzae TaxID=348818 RepID=UPI00055C40ED|nr:hypothetical protein [Phaeacidiphilus oryzae]